MKAFLAAVVVAIAVAAVMPYMLAGEQEPAWKAFQTNAVRLDDPGHGLDAFK